MTTATPHSTLARTTDREMLDRFSRLRESGDARLRDELVVEHRWIAERCASRFTGRGEPYDDLVQVALLALVKTVDRFDSTLGSPFPRYAIPSVMGELRRHFRDHTWRMSVSRRAKDLGSSLSAAIDALHQNLGRSPTPQEVASYLGIPLDHVIEAIEARGAYRPRSLSTAVDADGGRTVEDLVGVDDAAIVGAAERVAVRDAAALLDERRQRIILWRFYEGCTQSEIGERLGIGQVQVSRLLRSALDEMRRTLGPSLALVG